MKFHMDARRVGCGAKMDLSKLTNVRRLAGMGHFDDASVAFCAGNKVSQTIDTIGRFCGSETDYVETSVQHCINDLTAVGSRPEAITASITYGPEYETDFEMADLVLKLVKACRDRGIQLTNLHSILGDYSSLTLSAIGPMGESRNIGLTGQIFISGPIGNFKMGVLREAEGIDGTPWFTAARKNALQRRPDGDLVMTDVTGFGLAGSLLTIARRLRLSCNVSLNRKHAVDNDVIDFPFGCLTEDLRKEAALSFTNNSAMQLGSCRELCGPFILLADQSTSLDSIRESGAPNALLIGEFETSSRGLVKVDYD